VPGSASSQDVLQQTVNGFAQRVSEYADGIAGRLGQPLSGTQLSKDDAIARWNFSPLGSPQAADQTYHQLVAQGVPPGKALDQVYPMRSMLFRGPDLQSAIQTAKQIQGWAADASGQTVPEPPQQNTLVTHLLNQPQAAPQGPQMPPPSPAAPMTGMPPVPPVAPPGVISGMPPQPLPVT
jgi:hypothetical protein